MRGTENPVAAQEFAAGPGAALRRTQGAADAASDARRLPESVFS